MTDTEGFLKFVRAILVVLFFMVALGLIFRGAIEVFSIGYYLPEFVIGLDQ